jgi:hypothetical protein
MVFLLSAGGRDGKGRLDNNQSTSLEVHTLLIL